MKYNLETDIKRAETYFNKLKKNKSFIELKEIKIKSSNQNRYLHLILTCFAIEYGETLDYVKLEFYKKIVNRNDYKKEHINKKNGEIRDDWKSINDFGMAETSKQIERFRNWSSNKGIYLPNANENHFLKQIEIDAERFKHYI